MNGFIKVVNPELFQPALNSAYDNPKSLEIVFAITAFCDFLLWTGDAIRIVDLRHGTDKIIETGNDMTWFFDMDLTEAGYMKNNFKKMKTFIPPKKN